MSYDHHWHLHVRDRRHTLLQLHDPDRRNHRSPARRHSGHDTSAARQMRRRTHLARIKPKKIAKAINKLGYKVTLTE